VTTASAIVAPIVVLIHLGVHALFIGLKRQEPLFIGIVAVGGLALDHALFSVGIFLIQEAPAPAPLWLSCLWPVLATTFMHAFESLQHHLPLAAIVGAVGGAMSYIAGTRLSDVSFFDPLLGPALLGVVWFFLMPTLLVLASRASGGADDASASSH